jgi:hypothetical protein
VAAKVRERPVLGAVVGGVRDRCGCMSVFSDARDGVRRPAGCGAGRRWVNEVAESAPG